MKIIKVLVLITYLSCLNCGVRGNPIPLSEPPTLGRGRPTYDKGMDELLKKQKAAEDKAEDEEEKKRKKQ